MTSGVSLFFGQGRQLQGNDLTALPFDLFDELTALQQL